MRCHICDHIMEPHEIKQDELDEFMPCSVCLGVVYNTVSDYETGPDEGAVDVVTPAWLDTEE